MKATQIATNSDRCRTWTGFISYVDRVSRLGFAVSKGVGPSTANRSTKQRRIQQKERDGMRGRYTRRRHCADGRSRARRRVRVLYKSRLPRQHILGQHNGGRPCTINVRRSELAAAGMAGCHESRWRRGFRGGVLAAVVRAFPVRVLCLVAHAVASHCSVFCAGMARVPRKRNGTHQSHRQDDDACNTPI